MKKKQIVNEENLRNEIKLMVKKEMDNQGILRFIREITQKTAIAEVRRIKKNGNKL